MKEIDFRQIEAKWQKRWNEQQLYMTSPSPGKKCYILEMFAYPSGDIHMGHFRNYTIGDALARYRMMQGYDILHPFGWDAFGLPAEEAAIKRNIHPRSWTLGNISVSRETLKRMAISYDWGREVTTCLPDYYKWNQWIFLKMYEKGLAYQAESPVNWCPSCKTVLANEQVIDGKCWRCHQEATKKVLVQWFFRITAYAERLLNDLNKLDGWPENVKIMQRNWIGRSEGASIVFPLEGGERVPGGQRGSRSDSSVSLRSPVQESLEVFTTRPDTLCGVTFMSLAAEHPLAREVCRGKPGEREALAFIEKTMKRSELDRAAKEEKEGIWTGSFCSHPLTGEKIPIWIGDYVLAGYGTGAVMGVPAHDQRDFLFARKYRLPIRVVIQPPGSSLDPAAMGGAYEDPGIMVNSGPFNGIDSQEGAKRITRFLEEKGSGKFSVTYKLRDWLLSRQRYWGTPIPMIHCQNCGTAPVPYEDLPVLLPEGEIDFIPKGRSPLEDLPDFIQVSCPTCHKAAKRDPDTMDTFVDSSWYHLRYLDPQNGKYPFSREEAEKWLPIDQYIGGVEHACGHLLYFRFFTKFLYDEGLLSCDEPALRLFNHGMVLDRHGQVMSKSKGNAVSPSDLMDEWGVDVSRLAMFFAAPSEKEVLWNEESVVGASRFVHRFWRLARQALSGGGSDGPRARILYGVLPEEGHTAPTLRAPAQSRSFVGSALDVTAFQGKEKKIYGKVHWAVKRVSEDIERFHYHTAVAALMELLNLVEEETLSLEMIQYIVRQMTLLLAPFAPHLSEEIWEQLGGKGSIFRASWPLWDEQALVEEEILVVIQVNGKVRDRITVPASATEEELKEKALSSPKVKPHLNGREIRNIVIVPQKLVNIVV